MEQAQTEKKSKVKLYIIGALLLLTIGLGVYGYIQYKSLTNKLLLADRAITENKMLNDKLTEYDSLKEKINNEKDKCEKLLTQEEGKFANFTYCQEFLDFTDKLE